MAENGGEITKDIMLDNIRLKNVSFHIGGTTDLL